jgi:hypothetical protein
MCSILNTNNLLQKKSIHSSNISLTQDDTQWNLLSLNNQVSDEFYHQVIDNEQKNSLNTKSDYSSDIKFGSAEQSIPKLSYFYPSDAHSQMSKMNMNI